MTDSIRGNKRRIYVIGVDREGSYVLVGFVGKDGSSQYLWFECERCHKKVRIDRKQSCRLRTQSCSGCRKLDLYV